MKIFVNIFLQFSNVKSNWTFINNVKTQYKYKEELKKHHKENIDVVM